MTQTLMLQKITDRETKIISISSPHPLKVFPGSNLKFEDFQGGGFDYGYVDGELMRIRKVDFNDQEIILWFLQTVPKGKKVTFFVSAEYDFSPDENIIINYE